MQFARTTDVGGASNFRTIFALLKKKGPEFVLYSFAGGSDGVNPLGALINVGDTLYGTTYNGCASNAGTVYSLSL